jgi:hypothetical protein
VCTSSPRVNPHNVLESKILLQCHIYNLDCHRHKLPTLVADGSLVATCPDVIIVRQIDVEYQFLRNWLEGCFSQGLAVAGVCAVHRADFESAGVKLQNVFSESLEVREGLITKVGVVLEGECEFAVTKIVGGDWGMIEPLEQQAPGKEALVECFHYFGIRVIIEF